MNKKRFISLTVVLALCAAPAFAQEFDTSAIDSVFDSILNALTGRTGRTLMTIVAITLLIGGALNRIEWSRVLTLLVIIVIIGVAPTMIESVWGV